MRKKLLSVALCVAMAATALVGCGSKDEKDDTKKKDDGGSSADKEAGGDETAGSVYFLNFKPEIADDYETLMAAFTEETGIEAKVVTAAEGQYESTLKVEMEKEEAPTLFTVNGPVGYNTWKDYCADLTDTELYKLLNQKDMAISTDDGVFGIPLMQETYGLICNKAIFEKYFALDGIADTGCKSIEDINSFEKLKAVSDDMQAHKADLGIEGVFSEIALNSGSNWRITNHLYCLPLYYEYTTKGISDAAEIEFTHADQYKAIIDLYLTDSTVPQSDASSGSVDDSMLEFAQGKAAIAQNGVWAWNQINPEKVDGSVVKAEDLYYMPIYIGAEGEEEQGLCTGTENFVCINSQASDDDIAASEKFLEWLYTSETGTAFVSTSYGVAPFDGFNNSDAEEANPLVKLALADDKTPVTWVTTTTPSEAWKNALGENLLAYAEGSTEWSTVVSEAIDKWASEKAAANE